MEKENKKENQTNKLERSRMKNKTANELQGSPMYRLLWRIVHVGESHRLGWHMQYEPCVSGGKFKNKMGALHRSRSRDYQLADAGR